jgi:hypothetical protein
MGAINNESDDHHPRYRTASGNDPILSARLCVVEYWIPLATAPGSITTRSCSLIHCEIRYEPKNEF